MSNFEPLYFSESPARARFKHALGQTNHFVITILVGLFGIESGVITEAPEHLHAAWSPKDKKISAKRSAFYALESALVRTTDAVDTYIAEARNWPTLFQKQQMRFAIDGAKGHALPRLRAVIKQMPALQPGLCGLMETMFAWRNRIVHSKAETTIGDASREAMANEAASIAERYLSLDVGLLLNHFDRNRTSPALKEANGFVRASQDFVRDVDRLCLIGLDFERYLLEAIADETRSLATDKIERARMRMKRLSDIWGRDESRRIAAIRGTFITLGFSPVRPDGEWSGVAVIRDELDPFVQLPVKAVFDRLTEFASKGDKEADDKDEENT